MSTKRAMSKARVLFFMLFGLKLYSNNHNIIVSASTDAKEVYVHAQLILTLEIKTELALQNGSLGKPEIPEALVELLVEDEQKEIVENGVRNVIFVRSYAIFPSRAGPLTIPSIIFEGTISEHSQRGLGGFFGRSRRIRAHTNDITIQVKPIPASFPKNQPFLPVKSLTIIESFDEEKPELSVNKALTRRFEVRALGSLPSFLPVIKAPTLKGCEVYSESGTKSQKRSAEGLLASVNFSQVYLPFVPGPVAIPEQIIYWWDTDLDQLKTTAIRAFKFDVVGDNALTPPMPSITPPSPDTAETSPKATEEHRPVEPSRFIFIWPFLAALFFLLWLGTLILMLVRRRPTKIPVPVKDQNFNVFVADVYAACDKESPHEVLSILRAFSRWALEHEEGKGLNSRLSLSILELEAVLYGHKSIPIAHALLEVKKNIGELKSPHFKKELLPPLYPL